MPILANPYGLLALLGIPAVLAIHFLQRKAVELPVSTLFLLERTRRDAASGRRFERLIPSIPLWMQLLAILLLAWFLAEPRFQKAGSVQRIAVVVDSSASMAVFKQRAIDLLAAEIPSIRGAAGALELTVLESAPDKPRIYAGGSVDEMRAALEKWQPRTGLIDPTGALRLARSLVSRDGRVVYLTDTPAGSLPFDARLIAAGEPIGNVGFTGVTFETKEGALVWQALVRNYGTAAADRTWSLQTSAGGTAPRPLHLEPGALVTLQSAFPKDAENVRVVLSPDRFTTDDVLPLVAPRPKTLALFTATSPAYAELGKKLLRALPGAEPTTDASSADLAITSYDPLDPAPATGNAVVFVEDTTRAGAYLKGGILAEPDPLMDQLNWQSLLVRETLEIPRKPSDTVLLWQEKRPLIFLRETAAAGDKPATRKLCFNFDLLLSNAANQPAFIVLLHRFAETIRDAKVAPTSAMLETGQAIRIATAPAAPVTVSAADLSGKPLPLTDPGRAPAVPGFLQIRQNDIALLDAAVYFADTREADFSQCGEALPPDEALKSTLERQTRADPWWRIWLLVLILALLVSWKYNAKPEPDAGAPMQIQR
jgi:hypothetical protein